ncbi:MAG: vWA domain-containing protein [Eubacteriales bacterium]
MLNEFVRQDARPLPVILLLDVSGSMAGEKIAALNQSVKEMISTFANEESTQAEIHVSVITFGGDADLHTELMPAREIKWVDMEARGMTPLGGALDIASDIIEDKKQIPSRSYRPTVVLVSDGMPNDRGWEKKLDNFTNNGRTEKCDRWVLSIGADADESMLAKFLDNGEKSVLHAEDARDIVRFFRFITMSTTTRSNSADPNKVADMAKKFNLVDEEMDF